MYTLGARQTKLGTAESAVSTKFNPAMIMLAMPNIRGLQGLLPIIQDVQIAGLKDICAAKKRVTSLVIRRAKVPPVFGLKDLPHCTSIERSSKAGAFNASQSFTLILKIGNHYPQLDMLCATIL